MLVMLSFCTRAHTAIAVARLIEKRLADFVTSEYTIIRNFTSEDDMVDAILEDREDSNDPEYGCFIRGAGKQVVVESH